MLIFCANDFLILYLKTLKKELDTVKRLGGKALDEVDSVLDATHIVVPKGKIRRTAKLLKVREEKVTLLFRLRWGGHI